MNGPFDTERQARDLPEVQAVYAAFDADSGAGKMAPHTRRLLVQALEAAGVELGAFDERIAAWLAGWEPHTVAVIASWITRAAGNRCQQCGQPAPGGSDWCGACENANADEALAVLRQAADDADGRNPEAATAVPLCCRCHGAPVRCPGAYLARGCPADSALYCDACIDRCHEATDFAHVCVICATPEEVASGMVPGADAAWREAVRQLGGA
jgi:hypothetical protein